MTWFLRSWRMVLAGLILAGGVLGGISGGVCAQEKLGLETGYFTATFPADWIREDDDGTDEKSFFMNFLGPRVENAPVMISIEFFADGNYDFDGYEDFVQRNTWDILEDKPLAEAQKTTVNGMNALWFEIEKKTFLHPESKSEESVVMKDKVYVFLGKDRKGFFVLHYTAPSSVFAQYQDAFEKIASSFELL